MGDHFVLLVDRLLTESTLSAAIASGYRLEQEENLTNDDTVINCPSLSDSESSLSPRKIVECRICQDEDVDSKMETPCSCRGSLKYAHRKCVQRWCNEKGDILCEICQQQFKPGYTSPPPTFSLRELPLNFRRNWPSVRGDLNNPRLIAVVSTDRSFLEPEYDEYTDSTSRSISCCRSLAIIFIFLLVLRHVFPVMVSRAGNCSLPLMMMLLLKIAGIVVPICILLKAVTSVLSRRRRQQETGIRITSSDEETGSTTLNQPHVLSAH